MTSSKLMKMIYCDTKAVVRLETYADTIVIEKEGGKSYLAAIRIGGYPESVKGMSEAINGGGSIDIEIDGWTSPRQILYRLTVLSIMLLPIGQRNAYMKESLP